MKKQKLSRKIYQKINEKASLFPIINLLIENSFEYSKDEEEEFFTFGNGYIGVDISVNLEEIVFVNEIGDFLYIPFDYYALVGALIEYNIISMGYKSTKDSKMCPKHLKEMLK